MEVAVWKRKYLAYRDKFRIKSVGATTIFSEKTCGLPSGRPRSIRESTVRTVEDAGPYKVWCFSLN